MSKGKWKKIQTEHILKNKWLSVRKDVYKTPSGDIIDDFYVVERADFVVVVPFTVEKKFVLVEQYRHGLEREIMNFPMGFIDEGEEPAKTAVRELIEETGFSGGNLKFVGNFFLAPPIMKTVARVFFASGVERLGKSQNGDPEEINKIILADQSQIENFIETGKLSDLASLCSYLLVKRKRPLNAI